MALLGWVFVAVVFRPWLPEGQIEEYRAGLILLGAGALHGDDVRVVEPVQG